MSFVSLYLYVPDEGSLLQKYRDCTTSNDFELYIYIYTYIVKVTYISISRKHSMVALSRIMIHIYIYIHSVFVNCPIDSVTQYSSFH